MNKSQGGAKKRKASPARVPHDRDGPTTGTHFPQIGGLGQHKRSDSSPFVHGVGGQGQLPSGKVPVKAIHDLNPNPNPKHSDHESTTLPKIGDKDGILKKRGSDGFLKKKADGDPIMVIGKNPVQGQAAKDVSSFFGSKHNDQQVSQKLKDIIYGGSSKTEPVKKDYTSVATGWNPSHQTSVGKKEPVKVPTVDTVHKPESQPHTSAAKKEYFKAPAVDTAHKPESYAPPTGEPKQTFNDGPAWAQFPPSTKQSEPFAPYPKSVKRASSFEAKHETAPAPKDKKLDFDAKDLNPWKEVLQDPSVKRISYAPEVKAPEKKKIWMP